MVMEKVKEKRKNLYRQTQKFEFHTIFSSQDSILSIFLNHKIQALPKTGRSNLTHKGPEFADCCSLQAMRKV